MTHILILYPYILNGTTFNIWIENKSANGAQNSFSIVRITIHWSVLNEKDKCRNSNFVTSYDMTIIFSFVGIPTNRPWASNNHDQLLLSVILVLEKNHWDHLKHLIPVVIMSTLNRLKTWTYLLNLLLRKSSIPIFIQPESNTCAHPEWMVRLLKYRALRGK